MQRNAIFDSAIKLQTFGFWSFGLGAYQPRRTFYAHRARDFYSIHTQSRARTTEEQGIHCKQLAVSLSRFCAFSYFVPTEYEELGLSTAKLHIGIVDSSVFNPRTGVHHVFRFGDEWNVGMTKYENFPRLDCITSS